MSFSTSISLPLETMTSVTVVISYPSSSELTWTEYPLMIPAFSIFLTRWATVTTEACVFFDKSLNDWRASVMSSLRIILSRLSNCIWYASSHYISHLISFITDM